MSLTLADRLLLPEDEQKLVELHVMIYNLCDSEAREESQAD
jgi:hypothetical protein